MSPGPVTVIYAPINIFSDGTSGSAPSFVNLGHGMVIMGDCGPEV